MKKRITLLVALCSTMLCSPAYRTLAGAAVCEGDVILSSQAEVDAFDCTEVLGTLRISGPDITNLDALAMLTSVGALEVNNNGSLTNIDGLSGLRVITGEGANPETISISFVGNTALTSLGALAFVTSVHGSILISGNDALRTITGFSAITTIRGFLRIEHNPALVSIGGFDNLTSMLESPPPIVFNTVLSIEDNPSLRSITAFRSLQTLEGRFTMLNISGNDKLTDIDNFSSLTSMSGVSCILSIENNAALPNIDGLSSLSSFSWAPEGWIIIANNGSLEQIDGLGSLRQDDEPSPIHLEIRNNSSLTRCCGLFPLLESTGPEEISESDIDLSGNGAGCTLQDILTGGECTVCHGDVILSSQAEVDAFDCTEVTGFLRISGADITNLDGLSELTRVGGLRITDTDQLASVGGLASLQVITGEGGLGDPVTLEISRNRALVNLDGLSGLVTISGIVEIADNASLQNINGFPLITAIEILSIKRNIALTSINGFNAVVRMERLIVEDNSSLSSLDGFSSLERVDGRSALVIITNNAVLESIDGLSSLTRIEGSPGALLEISENPSLKNVNGLSSLSFVSGFPATVLIDNNLVLENIDGLSSLEFLGGDMGMPHVTITNNPTLSRCCGIYPYLSAAQGGVTVENNGAGCTVEDILAGGACPQSISGFSLINNSTGEVIEDFFDSLAVDRADPDFFEWTIQANTFPKEVGSVLFRMDNKRKHVDNVFPYTIPGHMLSSLKPGIHTLTAQVYSKHHKRGDEGVARTVIIEITNSAAILNFEVVDKAGNILMELSDGDEINIKDPAFRKITIRANTSPVAVGSVKFHLDKGYRHIENLAPYTLFGDHNGTYITWEPKPGHYKLLAVPYSKRYAQGHAGESLTVHFKVTKKGTYHNNMNEEIVTSHSEGPFVSIYPVPVTLELHIRMTDLNCSQVVAAIKDMFGRPVYSGKLDVQSGADYSISTADLKAGVYYLHVVGDNGYSKVIKFVKQ